MAVSKLLLALQIAGINTTRQLFCYCTSIMKLNSVMRRLLSALMLWLREFKGLRDSNHDRPCLPATPHRKGKKRAAQHIQHVKKQRRAACSQPMPCSPSG